MRISTFRIFSSGAAAISRQQAELMRTQQQLSSGKRVLTPSDDPGAASSALTTEQARALVEQYQRNQGFAQSSLELAESTLGYAGEVLQDLRTLAVSAGNGSLSRADRGSIAVEVRGRLEQLMGLANTRDGAGGYLFSGYQDGTEPFARVGGTIAYQGDQGSRAIQVGAQRRIEVSASGADVFAGARAGNGAFTITADPGNTGAAFADAGQLANPAGVTGDSYRVLFTGTGTYDVIDTTTATTIVSGAAYAPGDAIAFAGMRFTLTGQPSPGDRFDLAPAARQGLFRAVEDFAGLLEGYASGAVGQAAFQTRLAQTLAGIDQAHEHLLGQRTAMGARLRELDALSAQAGDQSLLHQQELSRLVDLDYAEAVSRLAHQHTSLDAAQKSYLRVTGLSLFNYL